MTVSVAVQGRIVNVLLAAKEPLSINDITARMDLGSNVIRQGIAQIRTNGGINGYCVTQTVVSRTNMYSAKKSLELLAACLRSSPIPMRIRYGAH